MQPLDKVLYTARTYTQGGRDGSARSSVSLPGVERDVAQRLLAAAHETCPYSRATRNNIAVSIELA